MRNENSLDNKSSCRPQNDGALLFHLESPSNLFSSADGLNYTISSRQLVTCALNPKNARTSFMDFEMLTTLSCGSPPNVTTIHEVDHTLHNTTTMATSGEIMTTTQSTNKLSEQEMAILDKIFASVIYDQILLQVCTREKFQLILAKLARDSTIICIYMYVACSCTH